MLIVLVNFFNHLGLELVSDLLNQLLLFIPNVLISSVLIIIGFYLAEFVSSLVFSSLEDNNFENPELISKLVFYSIAFFTVAISLTQMGIGENIITNIVSIFFGSIGLALAISFGLGSKDWAEGILKNTSARILKIRKIRKISCDQFSVNLYSKRVSKGIIFKTAWLVASKTTMGAIPS